MDAEKIKLLTADLILAIEGEVRPGLIDTPRRVASAWAEMLDGYQVDIPSLFKVFDGEGKDQLVLISGIETWSVCEHHLLPFKLNASVGYLPSQQVVGISKLERLLHAYSHRLQLQERIGEQVARALMTYLSPLGVAVVLRGEHLCMKARGVKDNNSMVVTSVMLGEFRSQYALRLEFLELIK